jgi:hypothetical protein
MRGFLFYAFSLDYYTLLCYPILHQPIEFSGECAVNPNVKSQAAVWEQICSFVANNPQGVGRSQVAEFFDIDKTVATYHLEKGVARKVLYKVYTWITSNQRGWVYIHQMYVPNPFLESEDPDSQ